MASTKCEIIRKMASKKKRKGNPKFKKAVKICLKQEKPFTKKYGKCMSKHLKK